jgi:hypothetical protein
MVQYELKGRERGEGGWNQRVGHLLLGKGPEWMGIRHHEQNTGRPSMYGVLFFFLQGVRLMINCMFCKYK